MIKITDVEGLERILTGAEMTSYGSASGSKVSYGVKLDGVKISDLKKCIERHGFEEFTRGVEVELEKDKLGLCWKFSYLYEDKVFIHKNYSLSESDLLYMVNHGVGPRKYLESLKPTYQYMLGAYEEIMKNIRSTRNIVKGM